MKKEITAILLVVLILTTLISCAKSEKNSDISDFFTSDRETINQQADENDDNEDEDDDGGKNWFGQNNHNSSAEENSLPSGASYNSDAESFRTSLKSLFQSSNERNYSSQATSGSASSRKQSNSYVQWASSAARSNPVTSIQTHSTVVSRQTTTQSRTTASKQTSPSSTQTVKSKVTSSKAVSSKAFSSKTVSSKAVSSKAVSSKAVSSKAVSSKAVSSKVVESKTSKVDTTDSDAYTYAKKVVELVNKERSKRGLSPLTYDKKLTDYAMVRAKEITVDFSHTRLNGKSPTEEILDMGYWSSGENIAYATGSTPESVVQQWMDSPGHKANILEEGFVYIGVGYFKYEREGYWVQNFAGGKMS